MTSDFSMEAMILVFPPHLVHFEKGEIRADRPTLVRVHVENALKDSLSSVLFSENSLFIARNKIMQVEAGVLVLLCGVVSTPTAATQAHSLESEVKSLLGVSDQVMNMDGRDYGIGAQILRTIGVYQIKLLSRRPDKKVGLKAYGLEIVDVETL